ncbi:MAG: alpha/beta hydrolase [Succinivibrionaceae bacterium]
MESENISEILFKPTVNYPETSFISNTSKDLVFSEGYSKHWFRHFYYRYWAWLGLDILAIQSVISKIAATEGERTRVGIFDTIKNYKKGNWAYEFSTEAHKHEVLAQEAEANNDRERSFKERRQAYLLYNLAANPYLRGDDLASQALLLNYKNYKLAASYLEGSFKEYSIEVNNKKVSMFFHTPNPEILSPCVVIFSNYQSVCTEYLRFYKEHLFPNGIAMLSVDLPGIGLSEKIPLEQNIFIVHEKAIDFLVNNIKCVDSTRIGILSQMMGCNAAAHILYKDTSYIKCAIMVAPILHSFFVDKNLLSQAPSLMRSILANKLGFDADVWENSIPLLQVLSVEKYGYIGLNKLDIPLLILGVKNTYLSSEYDVNLAKSYSKNSKLIYLEKKSGFQIFDEAINQTVQFFVKELLD